MPAGLLGALLPYKDEDYQEPKPLWPYKEEEPKFGDMGLGGLGLGGQLDNLPSVGLSNVSQPQTQVGLTSPQLDYYNSLLSQLKWSEPADLFNQLASKLDVTEEEKNKAYKQAMMGLLGSVIAGALAKALTGSDRFGAGIVLGGSQMANQMLQELEAKQKSAGELKKVLLQKQLDMIKDLQEQKNKFVTEASIWAIKEKAKAIQDAELRQRLDKYGDLLAEAYKSSMDKNGAVNPALFSLKASQLALALGLDPKLIGEIAKPISDVAEKWFNQKLQDIKIGNVAFMVDPRTGEVKAQIVGPAELKTTRAGDTAWIYDPYTGKIVQKLQGVQSPVTIIRKGEKDEDEEDRKLALELTKKELSGLGSLAQPQEDIVSKYYQNLERIKRMKKQGSGAQGQGQRSVFDLFK